MNGYGRTLPYLKAKQSMFQYCVKIYKYIKIIKVYLWLKFNAIWKVSRC